MSTCPSPQISVAPAQAANFLLRRHFLLGEPTLRGCAGVMSYFALVGSVQYDPLNQCGRNADLVLQSRIADYDKAMLESLLYEKRALADYYDKNLCIMPAEDLRFFREDMRAYDSYYRADEKMRLSEAKICALLREKGPLSSSDIDMDEKVDWPWGPARLSRAVLEWLFARGIVTVHHKVGAVKYYSLARDTLGARICDAPYPFKSEEQFSEFQLMRRIGAVGMLPNAPSDAYLCMKGFKGVRRQSVFESLESRGELVRVEVSGKVLFIRAGEAEALLSPAAPTERVEFLAPLDCLLWDRRLIHQLFGFDYTWEVYTPLAKRKYGYYVLPVLYADNLCARTELKADPKASVLSVLSWSAEPHTPQPGRRLINERLQRFAAFNACKSVKWLCPKP